MDQLVHGIRYFDLRVRYNKNKPEELQFQIYHNIVRLHPLFVILEYVRHFVEKTNEIVVLDFQEFAEFDSAAHVKLRNYITKIIGPMMSKRPWRTSLNVIWMENRTIFVGYEHWETVYKFRNLRYSFRHKWGDLQDPRDLVPFMRNAYEEETSYRFVLDFNLFKFFFKYWIWF